MAFPTTSVIDALTAATWDPSSNWLADPMAASRDGDPLPDSGVGIRTNSSWSYAFDQWFSPYPSLGPDVEAFVEIPTVGAGEITRVYARLTDPSTSSLTGDAYCYQGSVGGTGQVFRINNAAAATTLGSTWTVDSNARGVGIRITGTGATVTIEVWEYISGTWTNTQTRTDTSGSRLTAAGYVGMLGIDTAGATRWKNFGGGTYTPPYSRPTLPPGVKARRGLYTR